MAKAPWVPPDVNQLVLAMLEKDSRNRPTTAQVREAFARLHSAAQGRTTPIPFGMQTTPATPSPYGAQITPSAQHSARTPYERPVTPPAGVPYQQQMTPSAPHVSPYHQQPTPSTPQLSPYATPAAPTISPTMAPSSGGSKRGLVIGGVVVAVLAIAAGAFFVLNKKKAPSTAKEEVTQPSNVEVAVKDPTPTPPPDPTPSAGSNEGSAIAPSEGSASATPTEVTTNPDPVPVKPDPVKPDPVKPDPPKMGRVTITFSGAPRALVLIDGKSMGREASGKVSFSVTPGDHTIRVQAKGFKPAEQKIRVGAGGSESVKLTLEKRRTVNSVEDPFAD